MIHKETKQNYKNKNKKENERKKRREKEKEDLSWIELPGIKLNTSNCTNLLPLHHVEKYDLNGNNIWFTGNLFELLCCLACDCNYHDEKLCDVSKADCIAQDCILFSKLLEVSEVFLSFTCIFKS